MSEVFKPLQDLPKKYMSWTLKGLKDQNNTLRYLDGKGNQLEGNRTFELEVPSFHSCLMLVDEVGFCRFMCFFGGIGCVSICTNASYPFRVRPYIESSNNKHYVTIGINNYMVVTGTAVSGPCFDPDLDIDFVAKVNEQHTQRAINVTKLKQLDEQLKELNAEIVGLQSGESRQQFEKLRSQVAVIHKFVLPDSAEIDVFAQLFELKGFEPKPVNLLPAIQYVQSDATSVDDGLDKLSARLSELTKKISVPDTTCSYFYHLDSKWKALIKDSTPGQSIMGVIDYKDKETIRDQLIEIFGSVPDFRNELEIFGFVSSKLDGLKTTLKEIQSNRNKEDPYASLTKELSVEKISLQRKLLNFKCDTSSLERKLERLKREKIRREAQLRYEKIPRFSGVLRIHDGFC